MIKIPKGINSALVHTSNWTVSTINTLHLLEETLNMPITISQHGALAEIKFDLESRTKKINPDVYPQSELTQITEAFDDVIRDDDGYRAYHIIALWHTTNKNNWKNLLDFWLKRGINYKIKTKTSPAR